MIHSPCEYHGTPNTTSMNLRNKAPRREMTGEAHCVHPNIAHQKAAFGIWGLNYSVCVVQTLFMCLGLDTHTVGMMLWVNNRANINDQMAKQEYLIVASIDIYNRHENLTVQRQRAGVSAPRWRVDTETTVYLRMGNKAACVVGHETAVLHSYHDWL